MSSEVSILLSTHKIKSFYENGFKENEIHRNWPRLWNKHYRMQLWKGQLLKLNKFRHRLNFKSLRLLCVKYPPIHVYMSVMNWMFPERVGRKRKARHAYPIGGEYVVDLDAGSVWTPHSHLEKDGVCLICLNLAYDAAFEFLDKIEENYSDIRVVFSGRKGFHIHVLDFDLREWTRYNERNPLKSHEVARFKYTKHLKAACEGFDLHHFTLSTDVMRVITFPGSINGETGLVCTHLGRPKDFEKMNVAEIVQKADATKFFYNLDIVRSSELFIPALRCRR